MNSLCLGADSVPTDLVSGRRCGTSVPTLRARLALVVFFFGVVLASVGQKPSGSGNSIGLDPASMYNVGEIDHVNPLNGNVYIDIPVLAYPQRGSGLRLAFHIYHNDKNWFIKNWPRDPQPQSAPLEAKWMFNSPYGYGAYIARDQRLDLGRDQTFYYQSQQNGYNSWLIKSVHLSTFARESNGAKHYVGDSESANCSSYGGGCPPYPPYAATSYLANDGSGFSGDTSSAFGPDGMRYDDDSSGFQTVSDRSGNTIVASSSGWTDSLGRQIPGSTSGPGQLVSTSDESDAFVTFLYTKEAIPGISTGDLSRCPSSASAARDWAVPAYNGQTEHYYLCFSTVGYQTSFNLSSVYGGNTYGPVNEASGTAEVMTAFVLPNGHAYQFTYDNFLSITRLDLPTGGAITYEWQNTPMDADDARPLSRALKTRTVYPGDGQPVRTWRYIWKTNIASGQTPARAQVTIQTNPDGGDVERSIINYFQNGSASYYSGCSPQDDAQDRTCNSSGTSSLLRKQEFSDFSFTGTSAGGPVASQAVAGLYQPRTTVTTEGTLVNKQTKTLAPYFGSCTTYGWQFQAYGSSNANQLSPCNSVTAVTRLDTYDWGQGAPGPLLRSETTSYAYQASATQAAPFDRVDTNDVLAGSPVSSSDPVAGTVVQHTKFNYNAPAYNISSVDYGVSGHAQRSVGYAYNANGTMSSSTDGNQHTTTYGYDSSGAYVSTVTRPKTGNTDHVTSTTTDFNTGLTTSRSDENNDVTTYTYGPPLNRLASVTYPTTSAGSLVKRYDYSDTIGNVRYTESEDVGAQKTRSTTVSFDGMGEPLRTDMAGDGAATTHQLMTYDASGRIQTESYPYSTTPSGAKAFTYDALGRTTSVIEPDGANSTSTYFGGGKRDCDEVGHCTLKFYDSLSRLQEVVEDTGADTSHCGSSCSRSGAVYHNDAVGNLVSVSQHGKSGEAPIAGRKFTYDSLSRLITAFNPESGWICYGTTDANAGANESNCTGSYDGNSNLKAKTDARGRTTAFNYDALDRLTSKTYSDGTQSQFFGYDGKDEGLNPLSAPFSQHAIGHLSHTSDESRFASHYAYDAMGRLSEKEDCYPASCFADRQKAEYDLAGDLTAFTYPDGRKVKQDFDARGRMAQASYAAWGTNPKNAPYWATAGDGYDAAGHVTGATFGNGVGLVAAYDSRQRIGTLAYGTTSQLLWGRNYAWTSNSNLQSTTDILNGNQRQFGYDNLNRLTAAVDVSSSTPQNTTGFSNGNGGSTGGSYSGSGTATNTPPQWTDPNDSNLLQGPDSVLVSQYMGWSNFQTSMHPDAAQAPDGSMSAHLYVPDPATGSTFRDANGNVFTYLSQYIPNATAYQGETMTASMWMRTDGAVKTVDMGILAQGSMTNAPDQGVAKQVQVTNSWQQFQITGRFTSDFQQICFQFGGGDAGNANGFQFWGAKLEDTGVAGTTVTNYLQFSQRTTGPTWQHYFSEGTDNVATAPDGTQSAASVHYTGTQGGQLLAHLPFPVVLSGTAVTASVWMRSASGTPSVTLWMFTEGSPSPTNLGVQTFVVDGQWRRYQVTGMALANTSAMELVVGAGQQDVQIQVWGAQLETASTAGPYVPTAGHSVSMSTDSTNLLPNSSQMNAVSWTTAGSSLVQRSINAVTAPDQTHTGMEASSSGDSWIAADVDHPGLYDTLRVTGSVFLRLPSGASPTAPRVFVVAEYIDPADGQRKRQYAGQQQLSLTGDWQRVVVTTLQPLPTGLVRLFLEVGGSNTFTSGQVIDVWGAQMEAADHVGIYVASSGLPVLAGRDIRNAMPSSQVINGPGWIANGNISVNATAAPDGTTTAAIFQATDNQSILVDQVPNPSLYDAEVVTTSIYLRRHGTNSMTQVHLALVAATATGYYRVAEQWVQLTTVWQRTSMTTTNPLPNGLQRLYLQLENMSGGDQFDVWGPQLTVGSAAAPYTPTTYTGTSPVTGQPASTVNNGMNLQYAYDSFGNLTRYGSFQPTYNARNQINGWFYDASGNLLQTGTAALAWDAESKLIAAGGATYSYDAMGNRVEASGVAVTDTVYFDGRPVARLAGGQWTDLIYGPQGIVAEVAGQENAEPKYRLLDHLGTLAGTTDHTQGLINPVDYTPFGQAFSGTTNDPYLITGKERDSETGLDYFGARQYSSNLGRWLSPDWSPQAQAVPYASLADPQSLNLYAYVTGRPTVNTDVDGHDGMWEYGSIEAFAAGARMRQSMAAAAVQTAQAQQQTGQDPTLPTAVAPPSSWVDSLMNAIFPKTWGDMIGLALMIPTEGLGGEAAAVGESVLSRFGTSAESAARLGRKAAEAEAKIGIHGVSTSAAEAEGSVSTASRSAVEKSFPVHDTPTRADPFHKTVELPKPVTKSVADIFNKIFGR